MTFWTILLTFAVALYGYVAVSALSAPSPMAWRAGRFNAFAGETQNTFAAAQKAPVWPQAFKARFETSIVLFNLFAANSTMYYDFSIPAQRLDFDVCTDGSGTRCSIIFNASGAFRINDQGCCLTAPVGPPLPTWPQNLQFQGPVRAGGVDAETWVGGDPVHVYVQNPSINSPVFLWVQDINETWTFLEPFQLGPQPRRLFSLPAGCTSSC